MLAVRLFGMLNLSLVLHTKRALRNREDDDQDGLLVVRFRLCLAQGLQGWCATQLGVVYSERQLSDGFNTTTTTQAGLL